jgi:hypothetical protein
LSSNFDVVKSQLFRQKEILTDVRGLDAQQGADAVDLILSEDIVPGQLLTELSLADSGFFRQLFLGQPAVPDASSQQGIIHVGHMFHLLSEMLWIRNHGLSVSPRFLIVNTKIEISQFLSQTVLIFRN